MSYRPSLDWLNFLLADLRGGLGPYVNVFLLTEVGWDQATIGALLTASGLIGIAFHTPIGALIDATRAKRALIVGGAWALAILGTAIATVPTLAVVFVADVSMALLGAVFAPTVAAITLGLFGSRGISRQLGRNAAFDRFGNLFIAAIAAVVGTHFGQRGVFYMLPLFAGLTTIAVLSIPASAIDHQAARGLEGAGLGQGAPYPWRRLFAERPFVVLAVGTALFHFANAPMLALASQKLALEAKGFESAVTSAAIIVAQLATIPMAFLVMRANLIGGKLLLVLAFAAVPLRGILFALVDDPYWMIGFQLLDGVGAGLFDVLLPLVLYGAVRGSGRYNMARGIIGTIQGIGGASSYVFAGSLVVWAGYSVAFAVLSGVGLLALFLMVTAMPETVPRVPAEKSMSSQ
ncbi:Major Facilitator Superfamily (MFS) transporter [Bosea sp. LC85]|uniref:MFS transporter n=1 Tax=Bosea sp. LC85 TaxID=1502851 RepID=UPI0004E2E4D6|nr:MFS transporter [Bosea sp. LC85]KFC62346.1 Major Facilitator Superfamily (MFS) transporter [Bosea sp. LC85]